jgi:hypothetical protein
MNFNTLMNPEETHLNPFSSGCVLAMWNSMASYMLPFLAWSPPFLHQFLQLLATLAFPVAALNSVISAVHLVAPLFGGENNKVSKKYHFSTKEFPSFPS